MASLMIRDLDEGVKQALRELAAKSGRSMEAEARIALRRHVKGASSERSLGAVLDELFPADLRGEIDFGDRADDRQEPVF